MDFKKSKMAENLKCCNLKSSKLREFIKIYFLSHPLLQTKTAGEKVLDLGCGWGFYFKINSKAYGIDSDTNCIKNLKSKNYKVVEGNIASNLPFPNSSFDWIIAHDVLEHFAINELEIIFKEAYRVLSNNGHFLILVPNLKGYNLGIRKNVGHRHFVTKKDISFLSNKKFIIQKHFPHPFPRFIGKYFAHNKEVFLLKKHEKTFYLYNYS